MIARGIIVASVLVAVGGCGPDVTKRACMGGAGDNPLVNGAAMVRLDVYGPNAHCADGQLVAGGGAPILSHSYAQGQPISLDVPPGPHAIVLTTFADTDGVQMLGQGCTEADLSAGSQICFDLTITPAPDGGDDLSGAVCSTSPDDCPTGSYCNGLQCVPGCKLDSDCPKSDAGLGSCDTTTHTCNDCNVNADCGTAPGATCCNKHCTNTKSDPQNCNGCGIACTGGNIQCCNSVCSNPSTDANNCGGCGNACSTLNATTATCGGAMCSWSCNGGFAHCMSGNTGCDTNLGGSGKKLCGTVCVAAASCCSSVDCNMPPNPTACYVAGVCSGVGGTCSYGLKAGSRVCGATCCNAVNGSCNVDCTLTCTNGYGDCDGDPSNGCEVNLGSAGKKLCGTACIPVGTCCSNADCTMPQTPTACYVTPGSCSGAGGSCSYSLKSGSVVCLPSTCCNAISGTCNGNCSLNCAAGTGDCDGDPSNGCEHNTNNDPSHCGSCANSCNLPHTTTDGCAGGNCTVVTCAAGFYDCDAAAANGCEAQGPATGPGCCNGLLPAATGTKMTQHNNGVGGTYWDCYGLGTPGNGATYFSQMAFDAATSDAAQPGLVTDGWICGSGNNKETSVCKTVDQSGNTGTCTCWTYSAGSTSTNTIGRLYNSSGGAGDAGCFCPGAGAAPWN